MASREAKRWSHEFVCVEHLLSALLKNQEVSQIISDLGGDVSRLERNLDLFFREKMEKSGSRSHDPGHAIGLQRVIQRAVLHAQYSSSNQVSVGDLLAAVFTEAECHAVYYLGLEGISRLDVLERISHPVDTSDAIDFDADEEEHLRETPQKNSDPLERFAEDLIAKAESGRIDPLVGREREIERCIQVLCRRQKNNPLFVGDQGVGKTAIVEGLAAKVAEGKVPEKLKQLKIFSLDLGSLIAGTRYRGDFEQRFKAVVKALEKIPDAVLFIDEIHSIVGAGSTSGGTLDVANLLKPVLTSGKFRCIGSTTFEEYKNHFEKDRALSRRFLKIDVVQPSIEETVAILKGLKSKYEEHHNVRYPLPALRAAAELSAKHINDRLLPDKAIDVIDEAGALVNLQTEGGDNAAQAATVRVPIIERVVARMARIPERTVSSSDREKLLNLRRELEQVIFGQEQSIEAVVQAIRRSRAGLVAEHKPIGSFLFAGPTGVGKTEVAKQLARVLGLELLRFDMSEYMEKHTVARLIGAPPGYVGFDQGGLLTDAIIKNPHSVLLLDEIEKAHPDLFNVLLQVMDNASLTDTNGRKADFTNVILIMTTNVGSENMFGQPLGFGNDTPSIASGAIEKMFRPEFRNRLDLIVKFKALPIEIVEKVVDKFIAEIDTQLIPKKVSLVISSEARRYLAEKGFDPKFGARPIHRMIQTEIKDPLTDAILFGDLAGGGTAMIGFKDGAIKIEYQRRDAGVKPEKAETR